jgi:hypothetical protein
MSGKKKAFVSISREEYQRLQSATAELNRHNRAAKRSQRSQRKTERNLKKQYGQLEDRQSDFMRAVSSLRDELYEIEDRSSQQILDHKADLVNDVTQIADQQIGAVQAFFETHRADLLAELSALQTDREQRVNQVLTEIEATQRDDRRKEKMAANWLNIAANLLDHLADHYAHLPPTPQLLSEYEGRILLADQNYQDGLPEAALVAAQNIYIELTRTRVELEQVLQAQELQREHARETLEQLQDTVQANRVCSAIDMDGNETATQIEVNSWTDGELDQIAAQVDELLQVLPELTLEELNQLVEQDLPALEARLPAVVQHAKLAALDSQIRINIADLVIQALMKQDYHLQSSHYLHQDVHNGYYAQAVNREGSEVQVLVNPVGTAVGDNELYLDLTSRDQISENEYHDRAAEITQALTQFGLQSETLARVSPTEFYRPFKPARPSRQQVHQHVR